MPREESYAEAVECGHCGNKGAMRILHQQNEVTSCEWEERRSFGVIHGYSCGGYVYRLLKCTACQNILLDRVYHDEGIPEGEEMLYPSGVPVPDWVPSRVAEEYRAALRERQRNPNGYATLLGRVLDAVCDEQRVSAGPLKRRLEQLVTTSGMSAIQEGVAGLRNVGAHADAGSLRGEDVQLLEDLIRYMLDHLYLAPKLNRDAREAEQKRRAERRDLATQSDSTEHEPPR